MCASVPGVLSVYEGCYVLPVAIAVGKHDFDVLPDKVHRFIKWYLGNIVLDKVQKTVFRLVWSAVEVERKSFFQI